MTHQEAIARDERDDEIEQAQRAGIELSKRVYGRAAPLRIGFVSRLSDTDPLPPLIQMLRGGRGGKVRAALYTSFLWTGASYPHDVVTPARAWAALLGLPDIETNGVRRVRAAIDWLQTHAFIRTYDRPGLPRVVRPLKETGTGATYRNPGIVAREMREAGQQVPRDHRYFRVPATAWTTGLLARLTGPGFAMLLVLLHLSRTGQRENLWLSPGHAHERFGLSNDTRITGLRELIDLNVVSLRRKVVDEDIFAVHRLRNTYTFNDWLLDTSTVETSPNEDEHPEPADRGRDVHITAIPAPPTNPRQ